jgi:hypothetical protein
MSLIKNNDDVGDVNDIRTIDGSECAGGYGDKVNAYVKDDAECRCRQLYLQ